MTSRWLQAQLTLVINVLTLKTVDISSRFSPVFHHIYQWVKFEIIILDDSSDILKSLQPTWRHKLADIFIYISNKLKYLGNKPQKQETEK
jgi:hypothetical protein